MSTYMIAEMKFRDTRWVDDYMAVVPDIVRKHGGIYISQALDIERIEGHRENPDVVVIIQFPSKEDAYGFSNDPEYQPYSAARQRSTDSEVILVPGIETLITSTTP